jgi:3-vinyl bacteriochlorophyllide hydratase
LSIQSNYPGSHNAEASRTGFRLLSPAGFLEDLFETVAPAPWGATVGLHHKVPAKRPLYTPEERLRRDRTRWTLVQAVLAPIQFLVFAISLILVCRYLATGRGYEIATASILLKTLLLYTIMITGSIWEKKVFGKWLFAPAFFWEDVFSFLVLALQTAYLAGTLFHLATPVQQMQIAIAAYAAYAINAGQFIFKLRQARLEAGTDASTIPGHAA